MSRRRDLRSHRLYEPSGQAAVTLNGRQVYLGPHGTRISRDNYDRVVGEWLAAGRAATKPAAGVSVAELVNAFREAGAIPESHAHTYELLMSIIVRLYGRKAASEFGPLALKVVRQAMMDAGWNRDNVNNRTHMARRIGKCR